MTDVVDSECFLGEDTQCKACSDYLAAAFEITAVYGEHSLDFFHEYKKIFIYGVQERTIIRSLTILLLKVL